MQEHPTRPIAFLRDGAVTAVALLLAFAALDDITTDNATSFAAEYTVLVACAAWLLATAWRLLHARYRALGGVTLLALGAGVWAQRAIGPGMTPGSRPEYLVMAVAYLWFWMMALTMLWFAFRERRQAA